MEVNIKHGYTIIKPEMVCTLVTTSLEQDQWNAIKARVIGFVTVWNSVFRNCIKAARK